MAVKLDELDEGRILEAHVSGKLTHEDYALFLPEFEKLVREHGKVRVLFDMEDFHGWKLRALWDDLKLDARHFADIDRVAMVGDKRWEKGMSIFCNPFTTAAVRYFDRSDLDAARAWLSAA